MSPPASNLIGETPGPAPVAGVGRSAVSRVALLDAGVLAVLLVSLNYWLAPADPGWLNLNPSPYLLLPVLIGGRFGFVAGLGAGVLATVLIVAGQWWLKQVEPVAGLVSGRYFHTCLILIGGICGELQRFFAGRVQSLSAGQGTLELQLRKRDDEIYFLREAKGEVDRIVASHDSGLSTLDAEVRELYLAEDAQFYQQVLGLLHRQARVADAAIYRIQPDQQLVRQAAIGNEDFLPPVRPLAGAAMALLAIERKTGVSIAEFWKLGATRSEPYLICLPFLDADDQPVAVLMITGMPFFALNQKSVHLITVICKWADKVAQVKAAAAGSFRLVDGVQKQKVFTEQVLRRNLDLATQSHQSHHLPSALAFFSLPGMALALQPALERAIITGVRAGDFAAQLDLDCPNLAVLLPLTGPRIAQQQVEAARARIGQDAELSRAIRHRVFTLDESGTGDRLWEELMEHANAIRHAAG